MAPVLGIHMYGWNGWLMGLGMLLFWIVLIGTAWAVVVVVTRAATGGTADGSRSRARDLLAERDATGDIDIEEFHTRSRELEKAGK